MWLYPPFPISESGPTTHTGQVVISSDSILVSNERLTVRPNSVMLAESIVISNGAFMQPPLPEANGSLFAPSTIRGFSEVF